MQVEKKGPIWIFLSMIFWRKKDDFRQNIDEFSLIFKKRTRNFYDIGLTVVKCMLFCEFSDRQGIKKLSGDKNSPEMNDSDVDLSG